MSSQIRALGWCVARHLAASAALFGVVVPDAEIPAMPLRPPKAGQLSLADECELFLSAR
ncbi:hypothetical protein K6U06_01010 [Acidiferrimicrobium sp. IK]|uniref:hypothetical protein n=1 Tax=Acidiferrimicrobium sp. IK TaxID=2871700 RepID=UPI0021CB7381|nr:hypothetical protein [Acidiferrimicrobium sp. IK]MCU4182927.1 hypothetical protein [Acidiferrimicrobium sp. IK]